ncbi:hypothetical protein [Bacillus sp. TL12]|uniref:hypothetical protein n=1 Tax=Bacillus sp. TL12 TaxID=2894756 RepID=UPI001F529D1A|nr:hypothetical protein [Bacillus sp. TL12]MCI0767289.1 hypothetical protein [Bacillus sp. TL12]
MGMGRYQYYQMMHWNQQRGNQPMIVIDPKSNVREQFAKLKKKKGSGLNETKNQRIFTK